MTPWRQVVVTGLGVICSVAQSVSGFLEALRQGRSGIRPIRGFDTTGFPHTMASEVYDFEPRAWVQNLDPARMGRASQLAIAAARQAVASAGLTPEMLRRTQAGVCIGTTDGEANLIERLDREWAAGGPGVLPQAAYFGVAGAHHLSTTVARELGLSGEACVLANACAAGNYAIGHAFDLIRMGEADIMLAGGADCLSRKSFAFFTCAGAVAPEKCQPFSAGRKGAITGEGAAVLVLESLESALARGARIYARVLGYGLSCDGLSPSAPDRDSIALAIRRALADAGVEPGEIDYICAHGTGTQLNDVTELEAMRQVFGDRLPPFSSIKSMIGHTFGAAGAFGAVACCLAIQENFLPPTIHWTGWDPELGEYDCVPNQARTARVNKVMNNAFGVGGNNAILILGRYEDAG